MIYSLSHISSALRVLRSLRILRAYRLLNFSHSGLQQQFIIVFFSVFSLIFCSTAVIQFVETYNSHLGEANPFYYFHDCVYFIVVVSFFFSFFFFFFFHDDHFIIIFFYYYYERLLLLSDLEK